MFFQTAPPQPCSKARWTCAPELAGGAEASQKGLGDLMPAKVVVRSGLDMGGEPLVDGGGGDFAVLGGHYGGGVAFGADAVAPDVDSWAGRFELIVDCD